MKVLSTLGLTKLIQIIKSTFLSKSDTTIAHTVDLADVATSGDYDDLTNKPTIPVVNNATLTITQGGTTKGTFTANAGSDVTIDLDAGGSGGSASWGNITGTLSDQTDLNNALGNKVEKTSHIGVLYGTDGTGEQTTYPVDYFGQVNDVQINGTSVVNNRVASLAVDNAPTLNSTNLITSGGVYSAIPSIVIRDWSNNNNNV